MGDDQLFELFQIRFTSWEREWLTGSKAADSLDECFCFMPSRHTHKIREVLQQRLLLELNVSLPYSPFGMRIRRNNPRVGFDQGDLSMMAAGKYCGEIVRLVPNWNDALRAKRLLLKNCTREIVILGKKLRPPLDNTPIDHIYSVYCLSFGTFQLNDLRATSFRFWPK